MFDRLREHILEYTFIGIIAFFAFALIMTAKQAVEFKAKCREQKGTPITGYYTGNICYGQNGTVLDIII